jgi:hypothetical protein
MLSDFECIGVVIFVGSGLLDVYASSLVCLELRASCHHAPQFSFEILLLCRRHEMVDGSLLWNGGIEQHCSWSGFD